MVLLAAGTQKNLLELRLGGNTLGGRGSQALGTLLPQAPSLTALDLAGTALEPAAAFGPAAASVDPFSARPEPRALQKVHRSYSGDWARLADLCRTSLVFASIPQMEACLRAIGADTELEVVRAGDDKMRLREGFDAAALSGGYRDIQLCVRLNTAEARARGVHEHLCEVQLHFAPIIALKSSGGHQMYVLRRNLRGE